MTPVLEIADLGITIGGRHIVEGVSLAIEAGECLGVVGESGSGKSMTALAALGLLPTGASVVAGSSIRIRGTDILRLDAAALRMLRGAHVGIVFQDPMSSLNPFMRVGAQIVEAIRAHSDIGKAEARRKALVFAT